MTRIEHWTLTGAQGETIYGSTHLPDREPVGVLLMCHGFKGYKDYGFMPPLAQAAAQRGLIAHRFNFSHSGMTDRVETFERPDLFEKDTWSKQIHDVLAVAAAAAKNGIPSPANRGAEVPQAKPQVWFGHSRGGDAVLLAASRVLAGGEDAVSPSPVGVISASAPDKACSMSEEQRAMLHKAGRVASPSARTGQTLYVGLPWLAEIEADPQAFDPTAAAQAVGRAGCPLLVIHGDDDRTVPPEAGRRLAQAAGPRARLEIVEAASHTFNAPNPTSPGRAIPPRTQRLIELSCDFAVECCRG